MHVVDEPCERFEIRKSLVILDAALAADDAQLRFDLASLQKHNIHLEHMSLDKGSAHNPRFVAPYPNAPPVPDEMIEEAKQDSNGDLSSEGRYGRGFHYLLHRYALREFICENKSYWAKKDWPWVQAPGRLWDRLYCTGTPRSPNRVDSSDSLEVLCARRPLPHVQAAILVKGETKNGEFLRVEILATLRLMIHQMRQIPLVPHMKTPAMLVSILEDRARLIEAFCEDGKIIFRATRLYDLPSEYILACEQFAQWLCGTPIGDTS